MRQHKYRLFSVLSVCMHICTPMLLLQGFTSIATYLEFHGNLTASPSCLNQLIVDRHSPCVFGDMAGLLFQGNRFICCFLGSVASALILTLHSSYLQPPTLNTDMLYAQHWETNPPLSTDNLPVILGCVFFFVQPHSHCLSSSSICDFCVF